MTVRNILTMQPSRSRNRPAVLGAPAKPVTNFQDESLDELVLDMIDTMESDPICVGLAAPQLGIDLRVAVVCPSGQPSDVIVIINPTSVEATGQKDMKRESCMSIPDYAGNVERRKKLRVSYFDEAGRSTESTFQGFAARIVAHEIDHLDGIMYCDRTAGPLEKLNFEELRKRLTVGVDVDEAENSDDSEKDTS